MDGAQQLVIVELVIVAVGVSGWMIIKEFKAWWAFKGWQKREEQLKNPPRVLRDRIKKLDADLRMVLGENRDKDIEIRRLTKRNVQLTNELRYDPKALTMPLDRMPNPGRWAHLSKEECDE